MGVRNRTREIGARRAIGATRVDLLVQFLLEMMFAASLGCALGIAVAMGSVRLLDATVMQPFIFSMAAALLNVSGAATLFAIFVVSQADVQRPSTRCSAALRVTRPTPCRFVRANCNKLVTE